MSIKDKVNEWLERNLGGHVTIGPMTIFGFNAMHLTIQWSTKRLGTICFHPSLRFLGDLAPWHLGKDWPWKFYISPNCTPWASTFLLGDGYSKLEKIAAFRRWAIWGHGYDSDIHDPHAENEFFEHYVYHMREGDNVEICDCCEQPMTWFEAEHSNVCLNCLVKELARMHGAEVPPEERGDGKIPWGQAT